jgi:acetyl esterase/lipase
MASKQASDLATKAAVEEEHTAIKALPPDSSVHLTSRHDVSFYSVALQRVLRLFRPYLVDTSKTFPAGSPYLKPPSAVKKRCTVDEEKLDEVWIYRLTSKAATRGRRASPPGKPPHKLYYFAGGGFFCPPTKHHWLTCAELAMNLPQYQIHLVSYPLGPESPAIRSLPILQKLFRGIFKEAAADGSSVTLAGDSAGANIALSLALHFAEQKEAREDGHTEKTEPAIDHTSVHQVLMISPALDLRCSNEEMKNKESHDALLSNKHVQKCANMWSKDWSADAPEVSPLLADVAPLVRKNIFVHCIVGLWDVNAPDTVLYREKCQDAGIKGEWLEWDKQMHAFVLAWSHGPRECREGLEWCIDVLKRHA